LALGKDFGSSQSETGHALVRAFAGKLDNPRRVTTAEETEKFCPDEAQLATVHGHMHLLERKKGVDEGSLVRRRH
jgi:hypothetical protein